MKDNCKSCGMIKELVVCNECNNNHLIKLVQDAFDKTPYERVEIKLNLIDKEIENLKNVMREVLIELRMKKKSHLLKKYEEVF